MIIKTDCSYYLAYKPCSYHKSDARLCDNCEAYKPIQTRILIVKLDALGDVLRTTAILPALLKKYKNPEITWITKKNAFTLLKDNDYIDRLLAFEENFVQYLLTEEFDVGICLDADPKSSSVLSLAKAKKKYGFVTEKNGKSVTISDTAKVWWQMGVNDELKMKNRKTYQKHMYEVCELETEVEKPQIKVDDAALKFADEFVQKHNLDGKKIIGVNTGGGTRWQFKKWIFDYYVEFIRLVKKKYPDYTVLLFGGPEEEEMNGRILDIIPDLVLDTGCRNSIKEFAALIQLTDLFFTSDSLGMHISVALDITTVVLVGPTSPWELDVYGKGEIIYNDKMECIACYKSRCDYEPNCMNSLKPEAIFAKVDKYLG